MTHPRLSAFVLAIGAIRDGEDAVDFGAAGLANGGRFELAERGLQLSAP